MQMPAPSRSIASLPKRTNLDADSRDYRRALRETCGWHLRSWVRALEPDLTVKQLVGPFVHQRYVVSSDITRGNYGKFKIGVSLDGQPVGVKVLRSAQLREFDARRGKQPSTKYTPLATFKQEQAMMTRARARCLPLDTLYRDGKIYLIMPLMNGDLRGVANAVASPRETGTARPALGAARVALGAPGEIAARYAVARSLLRQGAEDIGRCHAAGLVHRDIKPDNFLWNASGAITLCDYGLAEEVDHRGLVTGPAGSPPYMAPEVSLTPSSTTAAETWSLGVTFVEVWTRDFFIPTPEPEAKLDPAAQKARTWQAVTRELRNYAAWHRDLPRRHDGRLDVRRIERTSRLGRYFAPMIDRDPVMVCFVLERLLHPDPSQRASMAEVVRVARSRPDAASQEALATRTLARLARRDRARRARYAVLEAHRKVIVRRTQRDAFRASLPVQQQAKSAPVRTRAAPRTTQDVDSQNASQQRWTRRERGG